MTLSFQRCLWAGILTIWGVLLAYFYVSNRVSSYLHPSFHLWMLLTGIVLILMAAGVLFLPNVEAVYCGEDGKTSPRKSIMGQLGLAGVLVVPLIVAAGVSPSQFGAAAINNRGVIDDISKLPGYQPYSEPALPTADGSVAPGVPSAPPGDYLPKTPEGLIKAQTVDLMYAAQEPDLRGDFENKEVELIGQFMPSRTNNSSGNRFSLVEMFVMCCAADARPVAVSIQTANPTALPEMGWVKVRGKATFPIEGGRPIPVVVADYVQPCDPPAESFIY